MQLGKNSRIIEMDYSEPMLTTSQFLEALRTGALAPDLGQVVCSLCLSLFIHQMQIITPMS